MNNTMDFDRLAKARERQARRIAIRDFRREVFALFIDTLLIALLWMFTAYIVQTPARGVAPFLVLSWSVTLLICVVAAFLWQRATVTRGRRIAELYDKDVRNPWYRESWAIATILLVVLTFVVAVMFTRVDLVKLFTQTDNISAVMRQFFRPEWSIALLGGQRLIQTLFMALMATFFGIIIAVPLSFVAARNLTQGPVGRAVYTVVRGLLSFVRSIPAMVWAILFVVWVKSGNTAMGGVLALFVHSVADLTKLYAERLESIDPGPVEAIRATGGSRFQVIMYGIVPQIINPYLSFTIYRLDINVRMSTIIGLVGGGGIGGLLAQTMRVNQYEKSVVLMMMIMATVWGMDTLSARLRERIESGSSNPSLRGYALRLKAKIASRTTDGSAWW